MRPTEDQNEQVKDDDFSLDQKLRSLGSEDLYDLLQNLMRKDLEVRRLTLEWVKENVKETGSDK